MTEISIQKNILPARFQNSSRDRSAFQTSIILEVLNKAITSGMPVSQEDIVNAYKAAKFKGKSYRVVGTRWDKKALRWIHEKQTPQEYRVYYADALQWFKSNLGAAIIKGKVLAIPVIEI